MAAYSASQAAARLGISRQTLYSYVSRGLLRAYPGDTHRERRYRVAEVNQLATQRSYARSPKRAARDSLNWGLPVVESSICCIDAGQLFYRGKNVLSLLETHSAEDIAALLWQCPKEEIFARDAPSCAKITGQRRDTSIGSLTSSFAMATRNLPLDPSETSAAPHARLYGDLVRILASCVLRAPPTAQSLRQQCAAGWKLTAAKARLVEAAMILCADHELNASSFTVRCVASTAASLHACVLAGLAALSGPHHGGMTARVESLWDEAGEATNPEVVLCARLSREGYLPGFGHLLYPDGDIRASAILEHLRGRKQRWRSLAQAGENLTGQRPSLDFALVALRRHLELPEGAALGIFSVGRSIGWIAHAVEQRSQATLIRPRAAYRGPPPEHQR